MNSGVIRDFERENSKKRLISDLGVLAINKQLLKNPFITCLMLKEKLNLVASKRTIRDYINKLGWTKVNTKYCQIVSPINRLKRFIYACCCKLFNEKSSLPIMDSIYNSAEIYQIGPRPQMKNAANIFF